MKLQVRKEAINNYLNENNVSKSAFCKKCHLSTTTLNKILMGSVDCKVVTLYKIARTMGVGIADLLDDVDNV